MIAYKTVYKVSPINIPQIHYTVVSMPRSGLDIKSHFWKMLPLYISMLFLLVKGTNIEH